MSRWRGFIQAPHNPALAPDRPSLTLSPAGEARRYAHGVEVERPKLVNTGTLVT